MIEGAAAATKEAFLQIPDAISGAMEAAINAVISGVESMINRVLDGVRAVASTVDAFTAKIPGAAGTNLAGGIGNVSFDRITGLAAGFGQIESQVMKPGMIGEVTCPAKPWQIIPMVVTEVQDVIASGQIRPTDQLQDLQTLPAGGTITVIMEPLYEGALDGLPQGANCIANAYTSNHDRLEDENLGGLQRVTLHAVDAVGLVHAMILRIQALLLPIQTLVLKGH